MKKKLLLTILLFPILANAALGAGAGIAEMDTSEDETSRQWAAAAPRPKQLAKKNLTLPEGFKLELPKEVIDRDRAFRAKQIIDKIETFTNELKIVNQNIQTAERPEKILPGLSNVTEVAQSILRDIANAREKYPDVSEREDALSDLKEQLYDEAISYLEENNFLVNDAEAKKILSNWYSQISYVPEVDLAQLKNRQAYLNFAINNLTKQLENL